MSSAEAAEMLGIQLPTLYAYVSRGLLHSQPGDRPREKLYAREDITAFKARRERRADPVGAIAGALDFGAPLRDSALTLIEGGTFYYRGHEAPSLARTSSIESVAALLWTGDASRASVLFGQLGAPSEGRRRELPAALELEREHPAESLHWILRRAKSEDPSSSDLRPDRVAHSGARLLIRLVESTAGLEPPEPQATGPQSSHRALTLATTLQRAWSPHRPGAATPINAALVLCADHELNVSSFTARCVASAGATPYDVVTAGLAALSGYRHGGHSDRVEALFDELGVTRGAKLVPTGDELRRRLVSRLQRGERIPGFGQPLYPEGDPRYPALMELMKEHWGKSALQRAIERTASETTELIEEHPTIDFALAALSTLLGLGPGGAWTLFALGRTVGWIAHAIEEYERKRLIRPRARYTGPTPGRRAPLDHPVDVLAPGS